MPLKLLGVGASGLLGLTLLGVMPASPQEPQEPPPAKKKGIFGTKKGEAGKKDKAAKKKGEEGPEGELNRAYNLLRRLRADGGQAGGRPDARIREWTDRAVDYYRNGLRALRDENPQLAHEYAAIAHDLARAIEHARNAALYDRPDDDLPPPPALRREGQGGEARKDLTKAYERLREGDDGSDAGPRAKYYRDAAGDLYRTARRDFEAGRTERAAELARAAEAMSHVAEHLGHAADVRVTPPPDAEGRRYGKAASKAAREGQILPPPPEP
jgi:hypothetical protein